MTFRSFYQIIRKKGKDDKSTNSIYAANEIILIISQDKLCSNGESRRKILPAYTTVHPKKQIQPLFLCTIYVGIKSLPVYVDNIALNGAFYDEAFLLVVRYSLIKMKSYTKLIKPEKDLMIFSYPTSEFSYIFLQSQRWTKCNLQTLQPLSLCTRNSSLSHLPEDATYPAG